MTYGKSSKIGEFDVWVLKVGVGRGSWEKKDLLLFGAQVLPSHRLSWGDYQHQKRAYGGP